MLVICDGNFIHILEIVLNLPELRTVSLTVSLFIVTEAKAGILGFLVIVRHCRIQWSKLLFDPGFAEDFSACVPLKKVKAGGFPFVQINAPLSGP